MEDITRNTDVLPAFRRVPQPPPRIQAEAPETPVPATGVPDPAPVPDAGLAQPAPVAPTPVSASSNPVSPPPVPSVSPAPVDTTPAVDQYMLNKLAQERDFLAKHVADQQAAMAALSKEREELAAFKRQQELKSTLAATSFEGLESIDPEDARKISETILSASQSSIESMQQQLERQRQELFTSMQYQQQRQREAEIARKNREIEAAHPDFFSLHASPLYQEFMMQRDGLSTKTRDQRASEEYEAGNTAYVIDLLNKMKAAHVASPEQIATVAPVQSAAGPTATPVAQEVPLTEREIRTLYQMHQISDSEYKERLAQRRAYDKAAASGA